MSKSKRPTVKQLQELLESANNQLDEVQRERLQSLTALEEARRMIEEQSAALVAAKADLRAAQLQDPSGNVQPGAETSNGANHRPPERLIPKPKVPRGQSIKIQESMGVDDELYAAIRYKIHALVHSSGLSWSLDFRHQEMDKLSKLYKGAAKAYPILKRYAHHWATAVIAQRYMQNIRRYAREKGTEPKYAKYNRGGKGHAGNGGIVTGEDDDVEVQDEDLL